MQAAKATQDTGKRNRIIQDVRDKVGRAGMEEWKGGRMEGWKMGRKQIEYTLE